ncbi:helix-turn-helix transcriptional regulator [Micromonospora sp. WMMD882]|uniref:helix-turn-helix domain-containing protein n=1 Tax=Micromonospora sp. WMMD882 TaxID=3015151 RepID=UPI00248C1D87|nr:helix-turn-helix transcriptional regulator [Micromonospora sp. WMMD882]WBB78163.1 helix-turn-helix transcriptional regulator [Micromonospora sp. WMMD882]
MTDQRGPTLRAQWLGNELREMRERAGLTLKEVAEYVRRNASTVSRFESGLLPARVPEVLAYLDICGVDDPKRRDDLKTMSSELFRKGWWDGYAGDVTGSLIDRIWMESRATGVSYFQPVAVPGLLQTREYAVSVIRAAHGNASEEQVERWVELRMARQQLLDREPPVQLSAIIDEAVVRRVVGGRTVMRGQLLHLVSLVDRRGVDIRVLSFEAGAHASPDGQFDLFSMPDPYPQAACMQTPSGAIYVEADRAAPLAAAYDRLCDAAMSSASTAAFLKDLAAQLE